MVELIGRNMASFSSRRRIYVLDSRVLNELSFRSSLRSRCVESMQCICESENFPVAFLRLAVMLSPLWSFPCFIRRISRIDFGMSQLDKNKLVRISFLPLTAFLDRKCLQEPVRAMGFSSLSGCVSPCVLSYFMLKFVAADYRDHRHNARCDQYRRYARSVWLLLACSVAMVTTGALSIIIFPIL